MIPKTLSASSLNVAALCMMRWKAQYIDFVPGFSGAPANTGSAVHGGLEKYVQLVYIDKTHEPTLELLESLYHIAYIETFGNADTDTDEFVDGLHMIRKWHQRTDFTGVEVISVEDKERMPVPVEINGVKETVPFTYIMDRLDRLGPGEYRVVDYKSVRVPIQPEELETKIQARAYALAVQRKFPDATKVRVVFDLLRHDPVGLVFSKEDNKATAYYLMNEAQRIIDLDETKVEPSFNIECGYCPVKATCPLLEKNLTGGGIHSLPSSERARRKMEIEAQTKANKIFLEELDELLLKEAVDRDELEWKTEDGYEIAISLSRRRQVDASAVARIVGPELFGQLGSITLGVLDNLIKDETLDSEMRKQLKELIYYKTGDPKPKVKKVK